MSLLAGLATAVVPPTPAGADNGDPGPIVVENTDDSGEGSLRAAIEAANATPDSTIVFEISGDGPHVVAVGEPLEIAAGVTILGPGPDTVVLDGQAAGRIFEIDAGAGQVAIEGLTVRNGSVVGNNGGSDGGDAEGGAILHLGGTLTIGDAVFEGNQAVGGGGGAGAAGAAGEEATDPGDDGGSGGKGGDALGGAIFSSGDLVLERVTFGGNSATGGVGGEGGVGGAPNTLGLHGGDGGAGGSGGGASGGAVFHDGDTLTVTASEFRGNNAVGGQGGQGGAGGGGGPGGDGGDGGPGGPGGDAAGGAIVGTGGLAVIGTTFTANAVSGGLQGQGGAGGGGGTGGDPGQTGNPGAPGGGRGGAIEVEAEGNAAIENSTVSGNTGSGILGVAADGILDLTHATVFDNEVSGGAALVGTGELTIRATIVAGTTGGDNCTGTIRSDGFNLSDDDACNLDHEDDLPVDDPRLRPLDDEGGSTETHLPRLDSPAVDAIPNEECMEGVTEDQRGFSRPETEIGACDIGAVERREAVVAVGVTDLEVVEGRLAPVPVTLESPDPPDTDVVVTFQTNDGTAVAGTDYAEPSDTTVTIPNGEVATTVDVQTLANPEVEDRAFTIDLAEADPFATKIGSASTTVTVVAPPDVFVVDTGADGVDGEEIEGVAVDCSAPGDPAPCTLRAAVAMARAGAVIEFAEGVNPELDDTNGQIELARDVAIVGNLDGAGGAGTTVSGGEPAVEDFEQRIFEVGAGASVLIQNLIVTGGHVIGEFAHGGGILNHGTLTLENSVVSANQVSGESEGFGGGIFSSGALTVRGTTIVENSASGGMQDGNGAVAGGIFNDSGTLIIEASTVSGNTATGHSALGGGVFNFEGAATIQDSTLSANEVSGASEGVVAGGGIANSGDMTMTGSTVSANVARDGGGIANIGELRLANSTVTENTAGDNDEAAGGGIANIGGAVTLENSTISRNTASGDVAAGGGLVSQGGSVTLVGSSLSWNTATGGAIGVGAGGIMVGTSLTLTSTTVSRNTASGEIALGGGMFNASGSFTVDSSTVSQNTASGDPGVGGGVLSVETSGTFRNVTVSSNTATVGGGVFDANGSVDFVHATVANNTSPVSGIHNDGGTVRLTHTIVSSNGPDCEGAVTSTGHNIASDDSCSFSARGDRNATNPRLGSLADNGGPTFTHLPSSRSPALNGGRGAPCLLAADQRGVPRPRPTDARCDVGAVEVGAPVSATPVAPAVAPGRDEKPARVLGTVVSRGPIRSQVTSTDRGYWILDGAGGVFTFGDAGFFGSVPALRAAGHRIGDARAAAFASTGTDRGYWVLDEAGGVFAFGDARFFGSVPALRAAGQAIGQAPAVDLAATPAGDGYWVLDEHGGVFAFGEARFFGSVPGLRAAGHQIPSVRVAAIEPTPTGRGYWVLDEHGGVFAFGDAGFFGSVPALRAAGHAIGQARAVDLAATPAGDGYWVVDEHGGVFAFGEARFFGSVPGVRDAGVPVGRMSGLAIEGTGSGRGYWIFDTAGGVFTFGDARFFGSVPGLR